MASDPLTAVNASIQRLWQVGAQSGLPDAQLLEQFLSGSDEVAEAAFASLVERHGPGVRQVCHRLLGDPHDAQDAAQATFLVLARKARSIRKPEALGSWLHGVALRLARGIRADAARRRANEMRRDQIIAKHIRSTTPREFEPYVELYEEIDRLPEKFRRPIVLCYLQGQTQEEASRQLGWPLGTVQSRLHRGRDRLRDRLARRGLGPSAVLAAGLGLSYPNAAAGFPATAEWVTYTARAAIQFAARGSTAGLVAPAVVRLAERLLLRMAADTLKSIALMFMAVGLAGIGALASVQAASGVRGPVARAAVALASDPAPPAPVGPRPLRRNGPDLDATIEAGVRFLKQRQLTDGSWNEVDLDARTGQTSLVTLALLTAGEPADSPTIRRSLEHLRHFTPGQLHSVYAISLQTQVFAAAGFAEDRPRIAANAEWLERAQIRDGDAVQAAGSWSYNQNPKRNGDNSNTFYALLGLQAAAESGVRLKPEVWTLARFYWQDTQQAAGGWGYTLENRALESSSMTCAGIVSLILCREHQSGGQEFLAGDKIRNCGTGSEYAQVRKAIDRLGVFYRPGENFNQRLQWRFYLLEGLERVGALSGEQFIGGQDWFRRETDLLRRAQNPVQGSWQGSIVEREPLLATSFALMFLARGRAPVLIQKARHAPGDDWANDPDDVRHLVETIARDEKQPMRWQIVDLEASADVDSLLLAPILFLNGHEAPVFDDRAKKALRGYVARGGFIFAEACCGQAGFDRGFRALLKEIVPEPDAPLHPIANQHPVWTARHILEPDSGALWGLEVGGRTVMIYSPKDLSCYWNISARDSKHAATQRALRLGENVVRYARAQKMAGD